MLKRVRSALIFGTGIALIVIGTPLTISPIPFGLPIVIIGALMVSSVSPPVKRRIRNWRARHPKLNAWIESLKLPPWLGSIRRLIEATRPGRKD